jgi:hypothetical protein
VPIAREPAATWGGGEVAGYRPARRYDHPGTRTTMRPRVAFAASRPSRRGARCDEVPAGAPRTTQARARCASAPSSRERPLPRTCSEEQSALPPPAARHPGAKAPRRATAKAPRVHCPSVRSRKSTVVTIA